MIIRLTCFVLCAFSLASCKGEKEPVQQSKAPENVSPTAPASDLPRRPTDFPPRNRIAGENVFPEDVLNRWGYLTKEVTGEYHEIRSKKNHSSTPGEAFYARFTLAKARFANRDDASAEKNRIESVLKTDAGFKNYTELIQQDEMLYSIRATSNYTFLDHQPKLMEAARSYLSKAGE